MEENNCSIKDAKTAADFLPYVQSAYWENSDEVAQDSKKRYTVSFIDGSAVSTMNENGAIETVSPGTVATYFIDAGIVLTDVSPMEEINGLHWSPVCENISFDQAIDMAKKYGGGWRLPTSIEMVGVSTANLVEHGEFIQEFRWTPSGIDYGPDAMSVCEFHFNNGGEEQIKRKESSQALNARFVKEIDLSQRRMLIISINGSGIDTSGMLAQRESFFGSLGKDSRILHPCNSLSFKR